MLFPCCCIFEVAIFCVLLLCALLVDSEEGNRRAIAIDSDEDKLAWIKRYARFVQDHVQLRANYGINHFASPEEE